MSAFHEQSSQERPVPAYAPRRKSGLETPLVGRFYREGKILVFAPPLWYDILVSACIISGVVLTLSFLVAGGEPYELFVSIAIACAGLWALASNERMICDLGKRTYTRFEGSGLGKHLVRGPLSDLDALVLTTEQYAVAAVVRNVVIYRLVLHWKGIKHPPLPIEKEKHSIPVQAPLNHSAGFLLARGSTFAQALGIRYFDNSHMYGKSPVPAF